MNNTVQSLNEFSTRCEFLKEGKYILSGDRMNMLLRFIANDDAMMELVRECNKNFDFEREFQRCDTFIGPSRYFKLPEGDSKIIALVTGLFYKFDRKDLQLHDFLDDFFKGINVNKQFADFCEAVVDAYARAVINLLGKEVKPSFGEGDEKSRPVSEILKEKLTPLIGALAEEVLLCKVSSQKRKEYIEVLDGLYYAVEASDERMVKAMWTGVKNTISQNKVTVAHMRAIDECLRYYGVIN